MKVLTLKQPWASLIASGYKLYEFRTWKTNYRGDFLIHAGKGVDKKAMERVKELNLEYPKGKIIAIATIEDCIELDSKKNKEIESINPIVYGNKEHYCYAWKLSNIRKISNDNTIPGKLGFWNYEL